MFGFHFRTSKPMYSKYYMYWLSCFRLYDVGMADMQK